MNHRWRALLLRAGAILIALLGCMAPTPGDVGGCGQKRQELDEETFFATKNAIECSRCQECDVSTMRCSQACDNETGGRQFPEGCLPLVHDGEVCLRRLLDVSCETFLSYVEDGAAVVPTECNFCPEEAR